MKTGISSTRIIAAIGLFTFLMFGAVLPWMFDLVAAQRAFGFLLSADLIALAMLVYVYDRERDSDIDWYLLLIGSLIIAMLLFFGMIAT